MTRIRRLSPYSRRRSRLHDQPSALSSSIRCRHLVDRVDDQHLNGHVLRLKQKPRALLERYFKRGEIALGVRRGVVIEINVVAAGELRFVSNWKTCCGSQILRQLLHGTVIGMQMSGCYRVTLPWEMTFRSPSQPRTVLSNHESVSASGARLHVRHQMESRLEQRLKAGLQLLARQ